MRVTGLALSDGALLGCVRCSIARLAGRILIRAQTALRQPRERAKDHPHRRADRERQVGAGAGAGRKARRHDHQCQFHAGLSRPAHHHGAADAGRGGARAAPALRPRRCGGELFRRPLVRGGRRRARGDATRIGRVGHRRRRHRALFQGADARACRRAADSRRKSATRCARGSQATAPRRCMRS